MFIGISQSQSGRKVNPIYVWKIRDGVKAAPLGSAVGRVEGSS